LTAPDDIDEQFREWLREAYAVGARKHLDSRKRSRAQTRDEE
jgi:hypothetical protein